MCGTRSLTGIQAFRLFLDENLKVYLHKRKDGVISMLMNGEGSVFPLILWVNVHPLLW